MWQVHCTVHVCCVCVVWQCGYIVCPSIELADEMHASWLTKVLTYLIQFTYTTYTFHQLFIIYIYSAIKLSPVAIVRCNIQFLSSIAEDNNWWLHILLFRIALTSLSMHALWDKMHRYQGMHGYVVHTHIHIGIQMYTHAHKLLWSKWPCNYLLSIYDGNFRKVLN